VQTYEWGKPCCESLVATLKQAADSSFEVDLSNCYAELWVGTHPNGHSVVTDKSEEPVALKKWIENNPESLGCFSELEDIPFMLKILSINKALSIQSHPDVKLAQTLHKAYPHLYKDGNHKPEIAIALTNFEALCGFRPVEEIIANIRKFPELNAVLSEQAMELLEQCERFPQAQKLVHKISLRELFTSYLHANDELVTTQLEILIDRLENELNSRTDDERDQVEDRTDDEKDQVEDFELKCLILRLSKQYPGDRGMMAPIFFNYLKLNEGQSIFLPANEPHAYLCGDIIECMACSDNVVRAGLTPKLIDRNTLCSMLTYRARVPKVKAGKIKEQDPWRERYSTPVEEFEVAVVNVPAGREYTLQGINSPTFVVVLSGESTATCELKGEDIWSRGSTYFLPSNTQIALSNLSSSHPFKFTIAHANLKLVEKQTPKN